MDAYTLKKWNTFIVMSATIKSLSLYVIIKQRTTQRFEFD